MPRVVVVGAGCIGQWIGGHLASVGFKVVFVGRSVLQRTLDAQRLRLSDFERNAEGGDICCDLPGNSKLELAFQMEDALRSDDFDAVFVCLKMHDNQAVAPLAALNHQTIIISLQNGVDNVQTLARLLPRHTVIAGMVPYGVVEIAPGHFRRGTSGALAFTDNIPEALVVALRTSGLAVELHSEEDMSAVLHFKLVVNLGNALNALVGQPLSVCMQHREYRQLVALVWEEGLAVMKATGTRTIGGINGQPLEIVMKFMGLPNIVVTVMQYIKGVKAVDPTYHSSMFYDLDQHRMTEIDELNERVMTMAAEAGIQVPVNTLLVRLIREAQEARNGSPRLKIEDLSEQARKAKLSKL